MRESISLGLMLLALTAGPSFGQAPPEKPVPEAGKRSLEELLATALRSSPDVQVAQAKVREAEAELRRTRLTLLQKLIEASAAIDTQRVAVMRAEQNLKRVSELSKTGAITNAELTTSEMSLTAAKTALAQAETMLNGLTGSLPGGLGFAVLGTVDPGPTLAIGGAAPGAASPISVPAAGPGGLMFGGPVGGFGLGAAAPEMPVRVPRGPLAERVRAALNGNVKLTAIKEMPLAEVLNVFRGMAGGVPFAVNVGEKGAEVVTLSLEGEIPLGSVFQALEDVVPGLRCYVRDYGVLITIDGNQPSDGMPLVDFWQKKADK
jgi:hypothetical protein